MKVYGGEVNATSSNKAGINLGNGDGTLTVYGGKVTAQGGEGTPAIKGYFKAGEGITNVRFYGKNPGEEEMTSITGNTTDKNYFYAGTE